MRVLQRRGKFVIDARAPRASRRQVKSESAGVEVKGDAQKTESGSTAGAIHSRRWDGGLIGGFLFDVDKRHVKVRRADAGEGVEHALSRCEGLQL
jgi:hypothetical protein